MIIELDGLPVKLFRKRIKNLNVRIRQTGDVHVSAPMALSIDLVYRFLHDRREWIDKHRKLVQSQPAAFSSLFQNGETLFYLGKPYTLIIHEIRTKNYIEIRANNLHFYVNAKTTFEKKQQCYKRWAMEQMRHLLPDLCSKWEAIIGVQANSYVIKNMKSRWGSCEVIKKKICFNLRLIEKPLICLEYVIVHELVHLLEASHNKRFHALMTHFMPDWKMVKKELNCR